LRGGGVRGKRKNGSVGGRESWGRGGEVGRGAGGADYREGEGGKGKKRGCEGWGRGSEHMIEGDKTRKSRLGPGLRNLKVPRKAGVA